MVSSSDSPAGSAAGAPLPQYILLYDGVCGFCARAVQWILDREGDQRLFYAPLQGDTAASLRRRHPEIPEDIDTVVYVADGRAYLRTKAILQVARHLRRPWRFLHALRWLPAAVLDLAYRAFAKRRYQMFGMVDSCRLPTGAERARFLP
jgi:predicted DCC family thiol-disulfide oxidoreductase YuxK